MKVISLPTTPVVVTQARCAHVARRMKRLVLATSVLAQAKRDYTEAAAPIIADLKKPGTIVEPGRYKPSLKRDAKRSPKWKQVVIDKLGKDEVDRILRGTEPAVTWRLVLYVPLGKPAQKEVRASRSA